MTTRRLLDLNQNMKLDFNIEIQRQAEQWDIKRKSLFIMSMLQNYPIPDIHIIKDGSRHYVIDGKQRLTTLFGFMEGAFKISAKLLESDDCRVYRDNKDGQGEPYPDNFILNQSFDGLPDALRERILDYEFAVNIYDRGKVSDADIENVYRRINNGAPLGADQKLKVTLGFDVLRKIHNLAESEFLSEIANISKGQHNKDSEMSILVQGVLLLGEKPPQGGFFSKTMLEYGSKFRNLAPEEMDARLGKIKESFDYLETAFAVLLQPSLSKTVRKQLKEPLKKITLPNIIALGYHASQAGIHPQKFNEWYSSFFDETNPSLDKYSEFCGMGTSAAENVLGRYNTLKASFEAYFKLKIEDFTTSAEAACDDEAEEEIEAEEIPEADDETEAVDSDDE
jgi:hypothetical protein